MDDANRKIATLVSNFEHKKWTYDTDVTTGLTSVSMKSENPYSTSENTEEKISKVERNNKKFRTDFNRLRKDIDRIREELDDYFTKRGVPNARDAYYGFANRVAAWMRHWEVDFGIYMEEGRLDKLNGMKDRLRELEAESFPTRHLPASSSR